MNIIHTAAELNPAGRKISLAIGFFDGVHLGHQEIIRRTLADARGGGALALVVTFDRHPNTVVAPHRVPPLVYPLWRRLRAIEATGIDALLLIRFDKAFSEQTGGEFIRGLAQDAGAIGSICVGASFSFGHKRSGNVALLMELGAALGFEVHGMPAVALDGQPISSTRIRDAIRSGDLGGASRMLGRPCSLSGRVVAGDRLGRQLGFPTANLDVAGLVLPPGGVYRAQALLPGGAAHPAVLNIGHRPTLGAPVAELRVEAHLMDFDADLYGQELEIVLIEKLREERKFASLAELKEQIARDVRQARG
jgi:riboflavin kinase/FMN adenylyltransferase